MNVVIKTPEQIEQMREAGKLAAEVLEMIGEYVKPGVTTCLLYTSPSPRDATLSRLPGSA